MGRDKATLPTPSGPIDERVLVIRFIFHNPSDPDPSDDGRTDWIPPPHLDTGAPRTNDYHHPERFLLNRSQDQPDPGG